MDLNKTDLLRLLSYLEGELQARDISIAALKVSYCYLILFSFTIKLGGIIGKTFTQNSS